MESFSLSKHKKKKRIYNLQQKKYKNETKKIIESIKLLEDRIEFVNSKIINTDKQIPKLTKLNKRKKKQQTNNELFVDQQ